MMKPVDKTGPVAYETMALVLTEGLDEAGEKWLSAPDLSRCFRSDRQYPTVEEAGRDMKALDYSRLAKSIEDILRSAAADAGGHPRIRISPELFPCKVLPRAATGYEEAK